MNTPLSSLVKTSGSDALADNRAADENSLNRTRTSSRDWRSRLAAGLPWLLFIGFFLMLALLFGKRLLPAKELEIVTVVTDRQSVGGSESSAQSVERVVESSVVEGFQAAFGAPMLFQASGWIEPDPYSVKATALIDGIVETVEVLEGDLVSKGQLLATLIDDDARLDLETSQSRLASLEAQLGGHRRQIEMAEAGIGTLTKQVQSAIARRDEVKDILRRLTQVTSGGVAEREISETRLKVVTLDAEVDALAATELELEARVGQLNEILSDFEARIAEAGTEVARKQLALDRTQIESPIDGRVLRLIVVPGQKRMLQADNMESATIAVLYDPNQLQARIDVPLAEAAQLVIGQAVRIRSEILPGTIFEGRVTRIVGEADLQRNTLQVKVAIANPNDRLRPEMLCRAEFLESGDSGDADVLREPRASSSIDRISVYAPIAAFSGGQSEGEVWKVDASGDHVVLQPITLGGETREDFRRVLDGLKPGDRVVLNPPADLKTGDRFRPLTTVADR